MQIYSNKSFSNPIDIIQAEGDLKKAFAKIDKLRQQYYLLGYITYDFKKLYFEVFDKFTEYKPQAPKQLGTIIKPLISKETYVEAINKIKKYIENGVTYEVNYTYPSEVLTNLNGIDLYEAILEKQKTPYNNNCGICNICGNRISWKFVVVLWSKCYSKSMVTNTRC